MNLILVLSLFLASAMTALAESVSNPFDMETPDWVYPEHTTAGCGSQLIEPDSSISPGIMPDSLHISGRGYEICGNAIEPNLKELGLRCGLGGHRHEGRQPTLLIHEGVSHRR